MKCGIKLIAVATALSVAGLAGAQSLSQKYFESRKPGAPVFDNAAARSGAITEIALERQAPHSGPHFMVILKYDGTAVFNGFRNADKQGIWQAELPTAVFNELAQQAQQIGFFNLKNSYKTYMRDMGTILTAVKVGTMEKIVSNYGSQGPEQLREFETSIEAAANSLTWRETRN